MTEVYMTRLVGLVLMLVGFVSFWMFLYLNIIHIMLVSGLTETAVLVVIITSIVTFAFGFVGYAILRCDYDTL